MKIGYIGLGLMGFPCVLNLIRSGYNVSVWARRPEASSALEAQSAVLCDSPAAVALASDIVFLNVTNAPDVEELLFGLNGIASSQKKGLIVVDMSTISATKTREFAARLAPMGIEFADAPVSGGTAGAKAGTLTFMVGASESLFARIAPVLESMGTTITRIGETGAGQIAKSCNQICITSTILGVAEARAFAEANGVDFAPVREALMGGFAGSTVLKLHGQRMIANDYSPGFKSALHLKDMKIVDDIAAEQHLPMPVSSIGVEMLQRAVDAGFGEEDSSAMAKVLAEKK